MATEPSEAAPETQQEPTPRPGGVMEHQFPDITPARILEKVQADREGALLVQSAIQQCMIEDQQKMIAALRQELVGQNKPDSTPEK